MSRRPSPWMAAGLLLVAVATGLRVILPNHQGGGSDFFVGLLMQIGIGLEMIALVLSGQARAGRKGRRTCQPPTSRTSP